MLCKKKLGADVTLGLDFDKIGQKAKETGEMPNPPRLDAKEIRSISEVQVCKRL